jgi:hypothetical protein
MTQTTASSKGSSSNLTAAEPARQGEHGHSQPPVPLPFNPNFLFKLCSSSSACTEEQRSDHYKPCYEHSDS